MIPRSHLALLALLLVGCAATSDDVSAQEAGGSENPSGGAGAGDALAGAGGSGNAGTSESGGAGGSRAAGGAGARGSGSGGTNGAAGGKGGSGGAGGAAGNGTGGGGSAGGPPIVVGKCDGLGPVGTWQNVSPPAFVNPSNMEVFSVVLNPLDQSVYASAGNKTNGGNGSTGVMKSTDCGATWKLVSTGGKAANLLTGNQWVMVIDPVNPQNIYTDNGYGTNPTIYKSSNGGVDWAELAPDPSNVVDGDFVNHIAMDPDDSRHLVINWHSNCHAPFNGLCLSKTNDSGATWQEFNGATQLTGWQEGASMTILGSSKYLYACLGNGAWFTGDGGQSWSQPITVGILGAGAHRTPDGSWYIGTSQGIYQSAAGPDVGKTWTKIANSPITSVLTDDGVTLFASYAWNYGGQPIYTAPLSNPKTFTQMKTPTMGRGANAFAYDASHHILYATTHSFGIWRVVTR